MSHFSGLIMVYKKTATIGCRSFFRSSILHKSILLLFFHAFTSSFPHLRADDQILVGELFKWELKVAPDAQKIKPLLNPPKSGILHSEVDKQDRLNHHIFLVPNQPGQLVIELSTSPNSEKQNKRVGVKPWPLNPPSTGIRAGVGKINGQWIKPPSDLIKVGEMVEFTLRLEGDSAIAIRSAPELVVLHGDSMIRARSLGVQQSWPSDAGGSSQNWTYEVPARGPGRYQVQPLRIHTWDKRSQSLQTKLISGLTWEVVASPIFHLETTQTTPPSNFKNLMPLVLSSAGILAAGLATVLLSLYTGVYHWLKLHVKLYQLKSCKDQSTARIWYRRLEPLWAKSQSAQKKCPPEWQALDRSRWEALERLAFGNLKDQDQNPIR